MSLAMIGVIGGTDASKARNDDDWSDKLSHRFTVSLLIVFAIVVTTGQYVGDAIHCWVPAHFSGSHEDYTNSYCWIKNTYYLPFEDYIPKEDELHDHIPYYQWVPLILLFQALLFYVPCVFWRSFNPRSGIDVNSMVESAQTFHYADKIPQKDTTLGFLVKHMSRFLRAKSHQKPECNLNCTYIFSRICCPVCGRRHGNYLIVLYTITKLLYIANAIGQLFMIDLILGRDFHMYGIDAITQWISGSDIDPSPRFPRVTMCDFNVRRLGNLQRYTVQCTIPINLFHEKIFLVLWFWIVMVAVISLVSFLLWVSRFMFRIDRHRYMKRHLRLPAKDRKRSGALVRFVEDYLRADGVFVLQLIAINTDAISATDIATAVWEDYIQEEEENDGEEGIEMTEQAPPLPEKPGFDD